MKQKITSILFALVAVVALSVTLVTPIRAHAASSFTYDDLKAAEARSGALCTSRGSNSEYCDRNKMYAAFLKEARSKTSADARTKYIDSIPVDWRGKYYLLTTNAYDAEVQAGKIDSGSDSSSTLNANGNCPDGEVEVSISPTSNGDKCVGGKNPIYTYLKDIIIFLGGAIGLAVVITIIVSGIQYSSSNGNPANITQAKERLINAVIGLVLYLFLAAILRYLVPQIFT